jgi:hypothetical protein
MRKGKEREMEVTIRKLTEIKRKLKVKRCMRRNLEVGKNWVSVSDRIDP